MENLEALAGPIVFIASAASLALPVASLLHLRSSSFWALVASLAALVLLAQPALPYLNGSAAIGNLYQAWRAIKGELVALAIGILLSQQKASALSPTLGLLCGLWGVAYWSSGFDLLQAALEVFSLAFALASVLAIKLWSARHLAQALELQQRAVMKLQEAAATQVQHDGQQPIPWDSTKLASQEPVGLSAFSNSSSSADTQDSGSVSEGYATPGPASALSMESAIAAGTALSSALPARCQPVACGSLQPHAAAAAPPLSGSAAGGDGEDEDEGDLYAQYRSPLGQTTRMSIKINTGHTLKDLPPDTARRLNVLLHTINQSRAPSGGNPVMLTRLAVREGCIFLSLGVQPSNISAATKAATWGSLAMLQPSASPGSGGSSSSCCDMQHPGQQLQECCCAPLMVQGRPWTPTHAGVCAKEDELQLALRAAAGVMPCLDLEPSQLGSVWVQAGGACAEANWDAAAEQWRMQGCLELKSQMGLPATTGASAPSATLTSANSPTLLLPATSLQHHFMGKQQQCSTAIEAGCCPGDDDGTGQCAVLRWQVRMSLSSGTSVTGAPLLPPGQHDDSTNIPCMTSSSTAGAGHTRSASQPLRVMVIANGRYLDTLVVSVSGVKSAAAHSTSSSEQQDRGLRPLAVADDMMTQVDVVLEAQVPLAVLQPPCLPPHASLLPSATTPIKGTAAPLLSLTLELRQGPALLDWLPAVLLLGDSNHQQEQVPAGAAQSLHSAAGDVACGQGSRSTMHLHAPALATAVVGASESAARVSPAAAARTQFVNDLATTFTLLHACLHTSKGYAQLSQGVPAMMAASGVDSNAGCQPHEGSHEWAVLAHLPHLCMSLLQHIIFNSSRNRKASRLAAVAQELLHLTGAPADQQRHTWVLLLNEPWCARSKGDPPALY